MKRSIIFISAVICLMLSSCGTDIEQAVLEPVGAEVTTASQNETAYETTTAQQISVADGAANEECCTPQTSLDTAVDEDRVPGCCSPNISEIGSCCGE
ncbi:MAG: hypothetical protein IJ071_07845 [Ruminococcus sp.]|nr:hypothetical protein [Ruminococcus sp.]